MFEFFDHTADLGIRVRAADLSSLFADAARGLTAAIVEDAATIQPRVAEAVEIPGADRVDLMFDWLRELLIRFETRQMLYCRFDLMVGDNGLSAQIYGEPWNRDRHQLEHEVKAITYHGLVVEERDGGWIAEFIVDI